MSVRKEALVIGDSSKDSFTLHAQRKVYKCFPRQEFASKGLFLREKTIRVEPEKCISK